MFAFSPSPFEGSLKRLLPLKRRDDLRAEKLAHGATKHRAWMYIQNFVAEILGRLGNESRAELFASQVDEEARFFVDFGIEERSERADRAITFRCIMRGQVPKGLQDTKNLPTGNEFRREDDESDFVDETDYDLDMDD